MCHVGQALRPFVEQVVGGSRVTLETQHQPQLFAEPLQRLVTIGCDRSHNNIVPVNLVKAVAHQGKSDPLGANYITITAINEHAVLLSSSWQSPN